MAVSSTWGTSANVEAKLLLLEHAFERFGCQRVEFKTDARNERSRAALTGLPTKFKGILRKHRLVPRLRLLQHRRRRVAGVQRESPASPRQKLTEKTVDRAESLLAPTANLGVYSHLVPVLRGVPADFILTVVSFYCGRSDGSCEVD